MAEWLIPKKTTKKMRARAATLKGKRSTPLTVRMGEPQPTASQEQVNASSPPLSALSHPLLNAYPRGVKSQISP